MAFPFGWSGYAEATPVNPGSTVTDFPFLVSLNQMPTEWWQAVQTDGDDIRVTDGNNVELPVDIIEFTDNGSSGTGLIAVKLTKATSNQKLRIWCGNASATRPAAGDTYGQYNAYPSIAKAFYPSGGGNDRTINVNHLTMSGSPTVGGAAGPINGSFATDYNGTSQKGVSTIVVPTAAPMALLAHVNPDNDTATFIPVSIADTAAAVNYFYLGLSGATDIVIASARAGGGEAFDSLGSYTAAAWHAIGARFASNVSRFAFLNGTPGTGNTTSRTPTGLDTISVGAMTRDTTTSYLDGKLSLVWIYEGTGGSLGADWISYYKEMTDDADQSDFYGAWTWNASDLEYLGTQVSGDGIWTWFNKPEIDVIGKSIIFGSTGQFGKPAAFRVSLGTEPPDINSHLFINSVAEPATTDDHDNAAIKKLASGKILFGWAHHNGPCYCALSSNANDISAFDSIVSLGGTADSYMQLLQASDDNATVFNFFRRQVSGLHRPHYLRTSTGADPTNFGSPASFINVASQRPYINWFQTSGHRFDFAGNNAGLGEANLSLYHGYVSVAQNGTWTAHKTDGTLVGDVDDLPFNITDFTLVASGATHDYLLGDIKVIGGSPVITSIRFPARDYADAYYSQHRWSGSSWSGEDIVRAGETGLDTSIEPTNSPAYTGLVAQDPLSADIVYASRVYLADANNRVEKYTKSGTWSKTANISGNTNNKNCRPIAVAVNGTTHVLWWSGTYGGYSSALGAFDTDVYIYPQLSARTAKAATPVKRAGYLPSGTRLYLPLQEASGDPVDLAGNYSASAVGAVVRTSTAFGYHVSGFATDKYLTFDALAADYDGSTLPRWMIVIFTNTSTTADLVLMSFGRASTGVPYAYLNLNQGTTGTVSYSLRDDNNDAITLTAAGTACNDGQLHTIMGITNAANAHRLWFDGAQVDFDANTLGTCTFDRATLGALRRDDVQFPSAANIYAAAAGYGAVPDPASLHVDWINGRFSGAGLIVPGGVPLLAPFNMRSLIHAGQS